MLSSTKITKDQLVEQFNNGSVAELSTDRMSIVIEAYKKSLAEKGIILDCLVFKKGSIFDTPSEYDYFLKTLEANKHTYPDNTRIQYVFLNTCSSHWTVADIFISNKKCSFYLLDAANLVIDFSIQIELIQRYFSEDTPIMVTALDIQNDGKNCGYFSIRLIKNLSEIVHLHQKLIEAKNPDNYHETRISEWLLTNASADTNVKYISREFLLQLEGFGSLFKNTQKIFNTEQATCGKENKLLDLILTKYRVEFTKSENGIDVTSIRNIRIYNKRKKMVEDGKKLLSAISEEECQKIIDNKNGKLFLTELENKKNAQKTVTIHIEEKSSVGETVPTIPAASAVVPSPSFSRNNRVHFYQRNRKVEPPLQDDKPTFIILRSYF